MNRLPVLLAVVSGFVITEARPANAQSADFVPGTRTLFALDLSSLPIGEFPKGVKLLRGNVTTVDKDGSHMLRASDPAQLFIPFTEVIPKDFTIEIDVIGKPLGVAPFDVAIEGTMETNRGPASMMFDWNSQHLSVYGGNPEEFQRDQPEDLKVSTPSMLTEMRISFDNGTFKVYVNGQRLVNVPGRQWARTRGLRLELGGQDDDKNGVYVSKLRIATNSPKPQ